MSLNKQAEELNNLLKACNNTVFSLLSKKGKEAYFPKEGIVVQSAQAKGKKINATIGVAVEDDGSPMNLSSISSKLLIDPKDVFLYAPSQGKKELRDEWLTQMQKKNPSLKTTVSTPIVTNALTHGASIVGYLFLDESDTIISPDKYWGNYKLIFTNGYGANIETFNTFSNNGFDINSMKAKLMGGGKKVLILNFPNNPSGYSPTKKEAVEITNAIKEAAESGSKIAVIVDDAYFGLFYEDETEKESLFSKLANLHENVLAIKLDGPTKEHYAWGLRVGFITYGFKGATKEAYSALEDKTSGAVRGTISNASNLSQSLVLLALKSPTLDNEKVQKFNLLKERYLETKKVANNKLCAGVFEVLPFNSGY
ncbi:MAG: aminotransferase class I/II-fold pyridoxal phosphate-dependent enzyme, partial [archaeon]